MIRMTRRLVRGTVLLLVMGGCGALDVSDPTAIEQTDVGSAKGAELLRRDALGKLYVAVSNATIKTGLISDELTGRATAFILRDALDRRNSEEYEQVTVIEGTSSVYGSWQAVRHAATLAIPVIKANGAEGAAQAHAGEMFAVRGFATLAIAENVCAGVPLHDVVDFNPVYGLPASTAQVFERALADGDSAVGYAADSIGILNLARIGRGRALLGLGRFAEAGAAAQSVPTTYILNAEFSATFNPNQPNMLGMLSEPDFEKSVSVSDREGTNGLDFVTADDPRVQTSSITEYGITATVPAKYLNRAAPIVMASGIEARLIEAEAMLQAGNEPAWLAQLNTLRTNGTQTDGVWNPGTGGVTGLAPLADPGTDQARVDLLFRERAFWLFGTNHRLGDLRRLIDHYGRQPETVFPTGSYHQGGNYGTATSIPFPAALETPHNPSVTGCTSR